MDDLTVSETVDSTLKCAHCGAPIFTVQPATRFCSNRCRLRAFRRRQRGVSERAYPNSAWRGRVPMDEPTAAERSWVSPGGRAPMW